MDLCVSNRVEGFKISFVRTNDHVVLGDDGVQFVLDSFALIFGEKRRYILYGVIW